MKLDCNIKLENILTANISTTQKYWIIQGLSKITQRNSDEEMITDAIIRSLYNAMESENKHK